MGKSTKAQKEARVNAIYTLLVAGASRQDVLQYAANQHWGLKTRQIDYLIAEANGLFAAESEYHRAAELGRAKARLELLIRKCLAERDYSTVLNVQRELNKMFGLHAPQKLELSLFPDLDPAILQTLAEVLKHKRLSASEVFEALVAEIREVNEHGRG